MKKKNARIIVMIILLAAVMTGCCRTYLPDHGLGFHEIPRSLRSEADRLITKNRKLYGNCYASEVSLKDIAVWAYDMTGEKSYLRISYLTYGEPLKPYVVEVDNPSEWLSMADNYKIWHSGAIGEYNLYLDGLNAIFATSSRVFNIMPEVNTIYEIEMDPDWNLDSISYPFIRHTMMDERKYVFNPDICPFKGFRQYYNEVMDSVAAMRQRNMMNQQKQTE